MNAAPIRRLNVRPPPSPRNLAPSPTAALPRTNAPRIAPPVSIYAGCLPSWRHHHAMFDAADAPDPDRVYLNYLESWGQLGIEPVPRERASSSIGESTEVLAGRPESTTH